MLINIVFSALSVKARVDCVEILGIHAVLRDAEGVAEALVVNNLALTKKFDGVADVGVVDKAQNVVVGDARLLLCYYHVFATPLSVALRRHLSQRARLLYV